MIRSIAILFAMSVGIAGILILIQGNRKPMKLEAGKKEVQSRTELHARIPPFGDRIALNKINSASAYIIISHLVRTLVVRDGNLKINGDLATKWTTSSDFTKFRFTIKKGERFSDGSFITAADIERTIRYQIESSSATHFDFSGIKTVSVEGDDLIIETFKRSPNFVSRLTHPEFGAIHHSELSESESEPKFKVTSGAYNLISLDENIAALKKNEYFSDNTQSATLLVLSAKPPDELKKYDFVFSTSAAENDISKYASDPNYIGHNPHIGFTFWLSFNSESSALSGVQKAKIQESLRFDRALFSELMPYWQPAHQLYLPDGFGRLNAKELNDVWRRVEDQGKPAKDFPPLKVLLNRKFPLNREIERKLRVFSPDVSITFYDDMSQFEKLSAQGGFDLLMINNDFSSSDLTENLKVTFHPSRPLIYGQKARISELIQKADNESDLKSKSEFIKEIERVTLSENLIVPLAYMRPTFYVNKKLDISSWSSLTPEVSFWKSAWKK